MAYSPSIEEQTPGGTGTENLLVVGIGASAGGVDAFRAFFGAMPARSGMSFVVVLHLPSSRKSMLPEILSRWTTMRVVEAADGQALEPDCVYVPPPHAAVTLRDGRLCIRIPAEEEPRDARPIDGFFDSLADSLGEGAVGIVLSGTGNDGALGLKAIKENGGFTVAQGSDGTRPLYDGMPSGAIATGAVDLIASVEKIPGHLMRLRRPPSPDGLAADPDSEPARLAICDSLREQLGHDFSGYKDKTFFRRVHRRMQVLGVDTLAEYRARLSGDRDEAVMLFRDLLIRVTSFFRDAETFDQLERDVIPRLFAGKHASDTVRVWVPGCATGEEAYSLAILLREHLDGMDGGPKIQVFATDIDEPAIAAARAGRYPATLLAGMSAARRERFFAMGDGGATVVKEIRELCTFSPHNLVRDPPFSRMDMISCRNLLIYLNTDVQAVVIPSFHYSLVVGGILLLGSSETAARHDTLFAPLEGSSRIFVRRDGPSPRLGLSRGRMPVSPASPVRSATAVDRPGTAQPSLGERTGAPQTAPPSARAAPMHGWLRRALARVPALRNAFPSAGATDDIDRLRRSLADAQAELRARGDEHIVTLEELRSANEEFHSVNEELQSTNEELETSKEELQSVNEELHTVNAQLSEKLDELAASNADLRNLFDSTDVATVFLDRNMVIRSFTRAIGAIYNLIPSDHGRPLTDFVNTLNYTTLPGDIRATLDTLRPTERRLAHTDGSSYYLLRILPYRESDDAVTGALVTFVDVTRVVEAETHQLLIDELNHRVKNMLTVVMSLAARTMRRSATVEDFSEAFMGRLRSLTASYTLLTREKWSSIALRDVVLEEVRPFMVDGHEQVAIEGPAIRLSSRGALAFGMVIHELATNAAKYGALSAHDGAVGISWRVRWDGDDPRLEFDWVESGGPAVQPPAALGFGTTLIERSFPHELSGQASIDYAPAGVRVRLTAPLGAMVEEAPPPAPNGSAPR